MAESPENKEHIVVIGGGMLGSLTALFAARAGYRVTLLEKDSHILSGAATVMARDHSTGMEYPASEETGRACVQSSMITNIAWKGMDIHTHEPPIWFTQDKELGKHTDDAIDLVGHYKKMLRIYHTAREFVAKKLGGLRKLFNQRTAPRNHDYNAVPPALKDKEQYFRPELLKGALQTEEKGFDITRRLALLDAALDKADVTRVAECDVKKIELRKTNNGNKFIVHARKQKFPPADQVFNAAGMGLDAMIHPCRFSSHLKCEQRKIGLIALDETMQNIPSIFIMHPKQSHFTGMFSRQNSRCALLYLPLPFDETPYDIDGYLKVAGESEASPFYKLVKHGAKGIKLLQQPLLIEDKNYEQRLYLPTEELIPGYSWGAALKGVYAERLAIEAVERFKQRTRDRKGAVLKPNTWENVVDAVTNDKIYSMKSALEGLETNRNDSKQKEREVQFVEKRWPEIHPYLLNDESYQHFQKTRPPGTERLYELHEPDDLNHLFRVMQQNYRNPKGPQRE